MASYFQALVISFVIAYLSILAMVPRSIKLGFVDTPSIRKRHSRPISMVGGLGIFLAFFLTLSIFLELNRFTYTLFVGSFALLSTGLIDDWFKSKGMELSPWPKLIIQLAVGASVYASGFNMEGIRGLGMDEYYFFPDWLSFLATVVWVVAMVNMMNFLDGLDGLAGGIAAISSGTLFILAIFRGQTEIAFLACILVGSCLGFLRHNFYPAKVFMGDSGSQVLGYLLAMISLVGTLKSTTLTTVGITLLALGVPILDTLQVFISRFLRGQPLYQADRSHVHHRLQKGGLSDLQVVGILYIAGFLFSIVSVILFIYWA